MSPQAGMILINEIMPRLRAAVPRTVCPVVGAEDPEELVQDAAAIASAMLHSAEARGRPLKPACVAYYAIQALRSGRRSGYCPKRMYSLARRRVEWPRASHAAARTQAQSRFTLPSRFAGMCAIPPVHADARG